MAPHYFQEISYVCDLFLYNGNFCSSTTRTDFTNFFLLTRKKNETKQKKSENKDLSVFCFTYFDIFCLKKKKNEWTLVGLSWVLSRRFHYQNSRHLLYFLLVLCMFLLFFLVVCIYFYIFFFVRIISLLCYEYKLTENVFSPRNLTNFFCVTEFLLVYSVLFIIPQCRI